MTPRTEVEIVACPEPDCEAPAEILERFTLPSTDGPVEHAKTVCVNTHVRTPLTSMIREHAVRGAG